MDISERLRDLADECLKNAKELIKLACSNCKSGKECYEDCPLTPVAFVYGIRSVSSRDFRNEASKILWGMPYNSLKPDDQFTIRRIECLYRGGDKSVKQD